MTDGRRRNSAADLTKLSQAVELHNRGQLHDAENLYAEVLEAIPNNPDVNHLLGLLKHQTGNDDSAIMFINKAIKIDPSQSLFYNNLGIIYAQTGRDREALAVLDKALSLKPDYPEALNNRGLVLKQLGRSHEALAALDNALRLQQDYVEAINNRGAVLRAMGNLTDALAAFDLALGKQPDYAEAHNNRGATLRELGRIDEAFTAFCRAIELRSDYGEARWNRALALLLMGRFVEGWQEFEWRNKNPGALTPPRHFDEPRWDGSALNGRTLLIHTEQGAGDSIQFIRFVRRIAKSGQILLTCEPGLKPLFAQLDELDAIVAKDDPLPAFDLHIPLMSLPHVLSLSDDLTPRHRPYLAPPTEPKLRLADDARPKIGLVWAGNPAHQNDHNRSMVLSDLDALSQLPGLCFYSLQVGPESAASLPANASWLHDLSPQLTDYGATAAAIAQLDLILSVDTSVAHLAGAMEKPTWIMLPFAGDWRWGLEPDETPWYPSMRLFRQRSRGDWSDVIKRVKNAMEIVYIDGVNQLTRSGTNDPAPASNPGLRH